MLRDLTMLEFLSRLCHFVSGISALLIKSRIWVSFLIPGFPQSPLSAWQDSADLKIFQNTYNLQEYTLVLPLEIAAYNLLKWVHLGLPHQEAEVYFSSQQVIWLPAVYPSCAYWGWEAHSADPLKLQQKARSSLNGNSCSNVFIISEINSPTSFWFLGSSENRNEWTSL